MSAAALPVPAPLETHRLQWLALGLTGALLGAGLWWNARIEDLGRLGPAGMARGEADWFFALRMPEVGPADADAATAAARVDAWLQALRREGFRPVRLAEALERVRRGEGLPEKSVAVLFDPGTRRTHEVLSPVLARHRWPAAWLTEGKALRRKDRRYVSLREARAMARSGWWDVGLKEARPERIALLGRPRDPLIVAPEGGLWADRDGKYALNAGDFQRVRRLNVNLAWSEQELLDRLMSEKPLTGPARLGLRRIQDMRWGVVEDLSKDDAGFELAAPADRRGDAVYWLGTRGVRDLRVDVQVDALMGELWLLLRSDEKSGESVRVAFTDGKVILEEERDGARNVVGVAAVAGLRQPASFAASVRLSGGRLEVWMGGHPVASADQLGVAGAPDAVARLMIYEKVLGAARAESVRLTAAPAGDDL